MDLGAALRDAFGPARVHQDAPLAPFTTFKVGGPADWLLELHGGSELRQAAALARQAGVPLIALGGGSNVLISDAGVRGIDGAVA